MSSINRAILSISIPAIVTNITTPLLGLMDVAIVGHMGSPVFIAAIAVGGNMFNMLYWLFGFLRMGTSGITSQRFGAKDDIGATSTLYRALIIGVAVGLAMILLSRPISGLILSIIDAEGETRYFALQYFDILVFGAPAVLAGYALTGWFVGMQNSKAAMWVSFFIDVTNIVMSLTLVYLFDMGLKGVAIGTLTAQWGGLAFGLLWVNHKFKIVNVPFQLLVSWREFKRFFSINLDIFLRTVCLVAVTMWFTRAGAEQGTVMLAVNTLLMQFFMMFSYFMDGFAFAAEALCGRYIGEKSRQQLILTIKMLFKWGVFIAIGFTCLYAIGGDGLMRILSSEVSVVTVAHDYYWWAVTLPLVGFATFLWDGVYIGATLTRFMLLSMLMAAIVFFVLYYVLFGILGNHGLWIAFLCYLAMRGIVLTVASGRVVGTIRN